MNAQIEALEQQIRNMPRITVHDATTIDGDRWMKVRLGGANIRIVLEDSELHMREDEVGRETPTKNETTAALVAILASFPGAKVEEVHGWDNGHGAHIKVKGITYLISVEESFADDTPGITKVAHFLGRELTSTCRVCRKENLVMVNPAGEALTEAVCPHFRRVDWSSSEPRMFFRAMTP